MADISASVIFPNDKTVDKNDFHTTWQNVQATYIDFRRLHFLSSPAYDRTNAQSTPDFYRASVDSRDGERVVFLFHHHQHSLAVSQCHVRALFHVPFVVCR
jgi:hypothetical protein